MLEVSAAAPISSRKPNFNSSGTTVFFVEADADADAPWIRQRSSSAFRISPLLRPPQPAHVQRVLSAAKRLRSLSLISIPPTWPWAPASMNARRAHSAVRIPHAGCHVSSWCPLMLRQISRLTSNRPEGVRKRKLGGRRGYVGGSTMRPW